LATGLGDLMGTTIHPDGERLRLYDDQVRRMVADPDMRADTLAIGLALAWLYRENGPQDLTIEMWAGVAKLDTLSHARVNVSAIDMLRGHLSEDAPRYEMERQHVTRCEAPMVRRSGLCGKSSTSYGFTSLNWEDGTRSWHNFCTRHRAEGDSLRRELIERDKQWKAERGEPPRPAVNRGGLLQRHFHEIDWEAIYAWARPHWKPPEQVPASYTSETPTLRLLVGDGEHEVAEVERPGLTVVHGMPDRLAGRKRPQRTGPRPL
jgi:hypothetical protein